MIFCLSASAKSDFFITSYDFLSVDCRPWLNRTVQRQLFHEKCTENAAPPLPCTVVAVVKPGWSKNSSILRIFPLDTFTDLSTSLYLKGVHVAGIALKLIPEFETMSHTPAPNKIVFKIFIAIVLKTSGPPGHYPDLKYYRAVYIAVYIALGRLISVVYFYKLLI